MKDQAEDLRLRLSGMKTDRDPRTLAVVSGKGGVGKSNFSLNFSISLSKYGSKVLLFDMDMGMGNLDILMGKTADLSIIDYFEKKISLNEAIMNGPEGLHYIAGGSGLSHLVNIDDRRANEFTQDLSALITKYDFVIFDMGAGLTNESIKLILSVQELAVITTEEPTAITDAYSIMKHIHLADPTIPFYLIVNRVQSEKEGQLTYKRIASVLESFLGRDSSFLGSIPEDRNIQQAVRRQTPFLIMNEKAPASRSIFAMTEKFKGDKMNELSFSNQHSFIKKLRRLLFER